MGSNPADSIPVIGWRPRGVHGYRVGGIPLGPWSTDSASKVNLELTSLPKAWKSAYGPQSEGSEEWILRECLRALTHRTVAPASVASPEARGVPPDN